ncbi:MAG: hypothetical protein K5651_09920 [Bacteroidales bacterium]|nr:hypothetical protein [Bacteroidales bacterium]
MMKRRFISPKIWIFDTGTESPLNSSEYSYDENATESGSEIDVGENFWD